MKSLGIKTPQAKLAETVGQILDKTDYHVYEVSQITKNIIRLDKRVRLKSKWGAMYRKALVINTRFALIKFARLDRSYKKYNENQLIFLFNKWKLHLNWRTMTRILAHRKQIKRLEEMKSLPDKLRRVEYSQSWSHLMHGIMLKRRVDHIKHFPTFFDNSIKVVFYFEKWKSRLSQSYMITEVRMLQWQTISNHLLVYKRKIHVQDMQNKFFQRRNWKSLTKSLIQHNNTIRFKKYFYIAHALDNWLLLVEHYQKYHFQANLIDEHSMFIQRKLWIKLVNAYDRYDKRPYLMLMRKAFENKRKFKKLVKNAIHFDFQKRINIEKMSFEEKRHEQECHTSLAQHFNFWTYRFISQRYKRRLTRTIFSDSMRAYDKHVVSHAAALIRNWFVYHRNRIRSNRLLKERCFIGWRRVPQKQFYHNVEFPGMILNVVINYNADIDEFADISLKLGRLSPLIDSYKFSKALVNKSADKLAEMATSKLKIQYHIPFPSVSPIPEDPHPFANLNKIWVVDHTVFNEVIESNDIVDVLSNESLAVIPLSNAHCMPLVPKQKPEFDFAYDFEVHDVIDSIPVITNLDFNEIPEYEIPEIDLELIDFDFDFIPPSLIYQTSKHSVEPDIICEPELLDFEFEIGPPTIIAVSSKVHVEPDIEISLEFEDLEIDVIVPQLITQSSQHEIEPDLEYEQELFDLPIFILNWFSVFGRLPDVRHKLPCYFNIDRCMQPIEFTPEFFMEYLINLSQVFKPKIQFIYAKIRYEYSIKIKKLIKYIKPLRNIFKKPPINENDFDDLIDQIQFDPMTLQRIDIKELSNVTRIIPPIYHNMFDENDIMSQFDRFTHGVVKIDVKTVNNTVFMPFIYDSSYVTQDVLDELLFSLDGFLYTSMTRTQKSVFDWISSGNIFDVNATKYFHFDYLLDDTISHIYQHSPLLSEFRPVYIVKEKPPLVEYTAPDSCEIYIFDPLLSLLNDIFRATSLHFTSEMATEKERKLHRRAKTLQNIPKQLPINARTKPGKATVPVLPRFAPSPVRNLHNNPIENNNNIFDSLDRLMYNIDNDDELLSSKNSNLVELDNQSDKREKVIETVEYRIPDMMIDKMESIFLSCLLSICLENASIDIKMVNMIEIEFDEMEESFGEQHNITVLPPRNTAEDINVSNSMNVSLIESHQEPNTQMQEVNYDLPLDIIKSMKENMYSLTLNSCLRILDVVFVMPTSYESSSADANDEQNLEPISDNLLFWIAKDFENELDTSLHTIFCDYISVDIIRVDTSEDEIISEPEKRVVIQLPPARPQQSAFRNQLNNIMANQAHMLQTNSALDITQGLVQPPIHVRTQHNLVPYKLPNEFVIEIMNDIEQSLIQSVSTYSFKIGMIVHKKKKRNAYK